MNVSSGSGLQIELHTVSVAEVACRTLGHLRKQLKNLLASPKRHLAPQADRVVAGDLFTGLVDRSNTDHPTQEN